MNILSLDQAIRISGISVITLEEELIYHGLYKSPNDTKKKKYTQEEKIQLILDKVEELIKEYDIDFVVFESVQKQVNVKTYGDLSILYGCLRQRLFQLGTVEYESLSPSVWRSTIGLKGKGRSVLKKKAQEFVKGKYGIDVSEDEADSISMGVAMVKKLKRRKIN